MKILHTAHHFAPCTGGIESFVEDVIKQTKNRNLQHEVVCLNKCNASSERLRKEENINGVLVRRVSFLDLHFYKIAPSVLQIVLKSGADLLHIHGIGFFSDFLTLTKPIHKKPIVISTHGGIFHTKRLSLLKKIYFFLWCRLLLRNTVFIAHSKTDLELFSKIGKKVILFPYPIDLEMFGKSGRGKRNGLLFVGRVYNNKRIDRLIKMLCYLKKKRAGIKLNIVGPDWGEMPKLFAKAGKQGVVDNVVFVGEKRGKALVDYFLKAKVFVSASEFEGFGISVLEAMGSGCIVAVNNIPAFSKFVDNGKNGFLLDYSKPELAAEILNEIMSMDRAREREVIENAKSTALQYSWGRNARKLVDIYRGVLQ